LVRELGIEWFEPYTRVLDTSAGVEWSQWFLAANSTSPGIVSTGTPARLRHATKAAVIWEGEDGLIALTASRNSPPK